MALDTDRIQAIFLAASEIEDPAERARHLDRECAGDAMLRARVEALLRALDQPDSLLDSPVVPSAEAGPTREFTGPEHANIRTVGHESGTQSDDEIPLGFLEPGTRPDSLGRIGHYEVLEVLGRGGFGIVFRAFDDVLQRVVAVKVMAPQLAATSPARKRFLREAQSSAAVRHENVVQVYETGEQPLPYLVMEFIPGETLQQRLDRTGPLDVLEALRIGRQIAEGLAAAHATDLIHRDIKPGNVLIESGQQRVKITDFGLARAADDASISQSGVIAGTPMYMAPEQALGQKLDQRADLFSLGSVLYQMVSGRPPFRANSTVAVLKRVAEDTPRPIREIVPEAPQWLCDIITKLHAKNPDERFQSARDVADVLADCETQLKANAKLTDFSRIPNTLRAEPPAASERRFAWLWWLVPVVGLIFALASMWSLSAMRLAITGDGEIEVANDSAQATVIVRHQDGPAYEMAKGTTIRVPSGAYSVEMAPTPGRSLQEWRITTHGLFSDKTVNHTTGEKGSVRFELSGGERVSVRAFVREEAAIIPPPANASPPPAAPEADYALNFTAASAQVVFSDLKLATSAPMTLEAYVTVRDTNPALLFNMRTPDHVRITLGENVGFWVGAHTAPVQRVQLGESLPVGRRVHFACVFDGRKPHLYIDGVRRNAPLVLVKFPDVEAVETRLGSGKNKYLFNGIVDEFRISTVARYKGDFTPEKRFTPDKDTFALYHCDEGTGDVLKDSSGNGRHGKIAGVTWVKVENAK